MTVTVTPLSATISVCPAAVMMNIQESLPRKIVTLQWCVFVIVTYEQPETAGSKILS